MGRGNGKFIEVDDAMFDTGAAVSITGPKYHSFCESVVSIKPVILRSASGMHTIVNKQGLMHVKLNGKDMGRICTRDQHHLSQYPDYNN